MKKMKKCRICNQEKPIGEFSKHPSSKDGLRSECKLCKNAANKKYNQANPEKKAASSRKYNQANPEKKAAANKKYNQANPEKKAAANKKYRQENREKIAASSRKYRQANPEKMAAANKKYNQKNPGKNAMNQRKVIRATRDWALHQLGGGCADCDLRYDGTNSSAFDFHHVNPSEKKNKISGAFLTRSKHIIQKELDKCVILCKPDHKKRHSDFKNGHRDTL